jgi:hypothetical protein
MLSWVKNFFLFNLKLIYFIGFSGNWFGKNKRGLLMGIWAGN